MHQTQLYSENILKPEFPTDARPEIRIPISYAEPKDGERAHRSLNSVTIQLRENENDYERDPTRPTQRSDRHSSLQENGKGPEKANNIPSLSLTKKWALNEICKMGLENDQIIKALEYIEGLPSSLTKEEMLLQAANFIVREPPVQQAEASAPASKPAIERIDICAGDHINIDVIEDEDDEEMNRVYCGICCMDVQENTIKRPLPCNHAYCNNCYTSFLYEKITSNQVLDINCPEGSCTSKFEDEQMKQLLLDDVYQKYLEFKQNKLLSQNPNVRWCIRPTCGKHIIGKKGSKKVVCECGMQICFECRNEYHPSRTCEQMMDNTYKNYLVQNDVQKCPRCKSRVEKIDGCNHVACTICNYQWCWLCGGKYTSDHYQPMNPFGCSGLQRGGYTRNRWPYWSLSILLCLLITAFITWPLLAAVFLPVHFSRYLKRRHKSGAKLSRTGKLGVSVVMVLLLLLDLCILPILMILCLYFFVRNAYKEWKETR